MNDPRHLERVIRKTAESKGYKMADIAAKVGMTQSNLMASIRKNPKLSTLQDLADALGCPLSSLLPDFPTASISSGLAMMNGKVYTISELSESTPHIPMYVNHEFLRNKVASFVTHALMGRENDVMFGLVDYTQYFTLLYDKTSQLFHLALFFGGMRKLLLCYDPMKYEDGDGHCDYKALQMEIINDLEDAAVTQLRNEGSCPPSQIDGPNKPEDLNDETE